MTTSTGLYTDGDVANILRGWEIVALAMPEGPFRDGYRTALLALSASVGDPPATAGHVATHDHDHGVFTPSLVERDPKPTRREESVVIDLGWGDMAGGMAMWGPAFANLGK